VIYSHMSKLTSSSNSLGNTESHSCHAIYLRSSIWIKKQIYLIGLLYSSPKIYMNPLKNNNILQLSSIIKEGANTQVQFKDEQAIIPETEQHMHIYSMKRLGLKLTKPSILMLK